jgi:adenosine kinase
MNLPCWKLGVDLSGIVHVPDDFTSNAFMNADLDDNQIAAFYPGAGGRSGSIDIRPFAEGARYGLVGATAPDAMVLHAEQIVEAGAGLVFDPAQQIVILSGDRTETRYRHRLKLWLGTTTSLA